MNTTTTITTTTMAALCLGLASGTEHATGPSINAAFANPPLKYHTTPLYWLNGKISNEVVDSQLTDFRDKDGYGSVAILPFTEWHEPEFMDKYGHMLDKLDELGMWAIFCDDQNFPSATAAGAGPTGITPNSRTDSASVRSNSIRRCGMTSVP